MGKRTCSIDGCDGEHEARGLCRKHWLRWRRTDPEYRERDNALNRARRKTEAYRARERQRNKRRQVYQQQWADAHRDWGGWWERQRRTEDNRELRTWRPKRWPQCRATDRPISRRFIGRVCVACGASWVSYEAMPDTDHCAPCNKKRWKQGHRKRARRLAVEFQTIAPKMIFERDRYRCQLCGVRTRGTVPMSCAPTLDHIIPMARGGAHVEDNLQCACFLCNVSKGAGAANDQMRMPLVG